MTNRHATVVKKDQEQGLSSRYRVCLITCIEILKKLSELLLVKLIYHTDCLLLTRNQYTAKLGTLYTYEHVVYI